MMPKKFAPWQLLIIFILIGGLIAGYLFSQLNKNSSLKTGTVNQELKTQRDIGESGENPSITRNLRSFKDMVIYRVAFQSGITLVSKINQPDSTISEQIWMFKLNDKEYSFTTISAPCDFEHIDPQVKIGQLGYGISTLKTNEYYVPLFAGIEQPINQTILENLDDSCKEVWGNLRVDSLDIERLKSFFGKGDSTGFEEDVDGAVDLRKVITTYLAPGPINY